MILPFKEQFVPKILAGTKIHTIRLDKKRRWKQGRKIHFATGVRTPNYKCFKEDTCKRVQAVELKPKEQEIWIGLNGKMNLLAKEHHLQFAINDGFDTEKDFWEWFNTDYYGYIIHWTDFLYKIKKHLINILYDTPQGFYQITGLVASIHVCPKKLFFNAFGFELPKQSSFTLK